MSSEVVETDIFCATCGHNITEPEFKAMGLKKLKLVKSDVFDLLSVRWQLKDESTDILSKIFNDLSEIIISESVDQ